MIKEKKKQKMIRLFGILLAVILLLCFLWFFWFEKYYLFHKQEKRLLETAEKYFALNYRLLPTTDGSVATVSLKKLYDEKWTTAFYVPKQNQLCDATSSWVKVRKEEGKLVYYTYLKCNKLESKVDHRGPEITLNGQDEIYLDRGDSYQELGVKSVVDQIDGTLLVDDVSIKAEVDSTKVGTYKVTYTAYDSLRNKTEKERTVVVLDMLNTVMKGKMGDQNYFQGNVDDNYVWFSGMLFQVVGINSDETTKLISAYNVGNMNYHYDTSFDDSDMEKWLNDYFYRHLSESAKKYVVEDHTWCDDALSTANLTKTTCDKETKPHPVGLLSIQELNQSLNETGVESYLQSPHMFWLLNRNEDGTSAWVNRSDFIITDDANYVSFSSDMLLGVRPVLNVKADLGIIGGSGTEEDPYLLNDYQAAKRQTKINTRESGEYLMYSGYLWRIMETTDTGLTRVVMDSTLVHNGEEILIQYDNDDKLDIYNPKQSGNIAYQIANELNKYVNTSAFVNQEITVPVYDDRATYQASRIDKYTVKIAAVDAYEIFSAKNTSTDNSSYWYRNSSKNDNRKYVMANIGSPYTQEVPSDLNAGVKLVAYLKADMKIQSGKGLRTDPYYVR